MANKSIPLYFPELNPAQLKMLKEMILGAIGDNEPLKVEEDGEYNLQRLVEAQLRAEIRTHIKELFEEDNK